jgi:type IV pilus assembly protein PilB
MARRIITKRIGEVLLERSVISRKELENALAYQQEHGGLLGQIFIQLGFATEEEIALALTAQYGFPYLPLENYEIDAGLTAMIPERVAREYCLIPIDCIGNALTLAMADPSNIKAIEDVELLTKCVVQTFVSTPSDIGRAIDKHYKHALPNARAVPPPASQQEADGRAGKRLGTPPGEKAG